MHCLHLAVLSISMTVGITMICIFVHHVACLQLTIAQLTEGGPSYDVQGDIMHEARSENHSLRSLSN